MKLRFSPSAVEDIQSITAYTLETWGEAQTDRYLDNVWLKLEEIRSRPECFKLRAELGADCRSALVGRHIIFFEVQADAIDILRVLHSSMDFETHL